MSKVKDDLKKGVENVLTGWSISENAKREIVQKYDKKKKVELKPKQVLQEPAPPQKKMDIESLKGFMFTKAEKKVYDIIVSRGDLHNITSPLSYQNIQDILQKSGKLIVIKTISRCIKSLISKGLIKIEIQPISTAGTRYNVTGLKDYLSQLLLKEE